jgi:hypothetical protein
MNQNYVVIEEPLPLRHCVLDYDAFAPDGSPDSTWKISVEDAQGFGSRKYIFKGDTVELSAMWKCCLNRQINVCRAANAKLHQGSSVSSEPSEVRSYLLNFNHNFVKLNCRLFCNGVKLSCQENWHTELIESVL